MSTATHYVIIGNGVAGNEAASVLRARDPSSRVTILSPTTLLFFRRYSLPDVFRGRHDWRDYLVHPPAYYEDNRITVRRRNTATAVDASRRVLTLAHREEIAYDKLLVATGGSGYLPEPLRDWSHLMHSFNTFRTAMEFHAALPSGGKVVMLGGDMLGLDLGRTLIATGYRVALVTGPRTFWPHEVDAEERPRFHAALADMGFEIVADAWVNSIESGAAGMPARRVVFAGGADLHGDVVMPSFGLTPNVDFMLGSGIDIERGILVNPQLRSTDESIWAAGDVCQIWSPERNDYHFYYGWTNVKKMGALAARNMTGEDQPFETLASAPLAIDSKGAVTSPYWEYDQ